MRKLIITGMAIAMLAVPAASMAPPRRDRELPTIKDGIERCISTASEHPARQHRSARPPSQSRRTASSSRATAQARTTRPRPPASRADAVQALLVNGLDK